MTIQNTRNKIFIFSQDNILVAGDEPPELPDAGINTAGLGEPGSRLQFSNGSGGPVWALYYDDAVTPPEGFRFIHLRQLFARADGTLFSLFSRAYQISRWNTTTRFCGRCGTPTELVRPEYSKRCPSCGLHIFPQIAPAIIIAVIKDGRLLMAHNIRFPEGLYSLVAGFMDPGETIEECARREVMEETGIGIKNIRYYGSQPWPFPHSLMIGLICDYDSGEIIPDGEEISDARWFSPDDIPIIPGYGSISRKIIDWYLDTYRTN